MKYETIKSPAALADLCRRLKSAERIGFDTEFVSEDTFRPELCLIQVATSDLLAVIDPKAVDDVTPFWETLVQGKQVTVVHAAREEVNFSLQAVNAVPANLFDTQLAAALCSNEYPAAYASVVTRFLGHRPAKGEQRTDWRRRPLTDEQIDYALEDVRYLLALHETMEREISRLGRTSWLNEETSAFLTEVDAARSRNRWRKVSGIGSLAPRQLAIVRELWHWRQCEAEQRNLPPRRILRDDLIVELARRKSAKPDHIKAIRGMDQGLLRRKLQELSDHIQRALETPLEDLGVFPSHRDVMPSQLNLLGQFLGPAISSICRSAGVAASLAATASDVRDLIAYQLGFGDASEKHPPALALGWRAELIGNLIDDLLAGRKSIRIEDPRSEHPLAFDPVPVDDD